MSSGSSGPSVGCQQYVYCPFTADGWDLTLASIRLQCLDRYTNGPVTGADIDQAEDLLSLSTYEYWFGSLNTAKEQAGVATLDRGDGQRGPSFSESELLEALHHCADAFEKPVQSLTKSDVDRFSGCPSVTTYHRWFGSWSNAKKRAQVT